MVRPSGDDPRRCKGKSEPLWVALGPERDPVMKISLIPVANCLVGKWENVPYLRTSISPPGVGVSTRTPLLLMFTGTGPQPCVSCETTVRNSCPWFTTTSSRSTQAPFEYASI